MSTSTFLRSTLRLQSEWLLFMPSNLQLAVRFSFARFQTQRLKKSMSNNPIQTYYYYYYYSFVKRTIPLRNQLPADALGTSSCKSRNFGKRVRKVINKAKWRCGRNHPKMRWSEANYDDVKGACVQWSGMRGKSWRNESSSVQDIIYYITVTV
jgi:hypothetical protein